MLCLIVGFTVFWALNLRYFTNFFHLDSFVPILLVAAMNIANLFMFFCIGMFQGLGLYQSINVLGLIFVLMRITFIFVFVKFMSGSYQGGFLAMIVATIIAVTWGFAKTRGSFKFQWIPWARCKVLLKRFFYAALPITGVVFGVAVLSNIDVALVKHFCTAEETGSFSVASVLGRTTLLLPGALIYIIYPESLRQALKGEKKLSQLIKDASLTLTLAISMCIVLFIGKDIFITTLFGATYAEADTYLYIVAFTMSMVALLNVFLNHHLASGRYRAFVPSLVIYAVTFGLIFTTMHTSAKQIAYTLMWGALASVTVEIGSLVRDLARTRQGLAKI